MMDEWGFRPVDKEIANSLEEACQKNGWLMRGGYDWQDDPYLEEYPYSFSTTDSIDGLRGFFESGNWAIRQGVCYKDLAFVQQVNGGDEWWTLKKVDDGWLDFESITFGSLVKDPARFNHMICSMVAASPELCRHLDYLSSQDIADRLIALTEEYDYYGIQDTCPNPEDLRTYVIKSMQETPAALHDWLLEIAEETNNQEAQQLVDFFSEGKEKLEAKQESLSDKVDRVRAAEVRQVSQPAKAKDIRDK